MVIGSFLKFIWSANALTASSLTGLCLVELDFTCGIRQGQLGLCGLEAHPTPELWSQSSIFDFDAFLIHRLLSHSG